MNFSETDLEANYPSIPWRTPLPIHAANGASGLACRFCVAMGGLQGSAVAQLPQTPEAFAEHMKEKHERRN